MGKGSGKTIRNEDPSVPVELNGTLIASSTITNSTIDGTVIGSNSASAATFTTVTTNTQLLSNDIDTTTATTLLIGKSTATKLELGDTGVITEIQGPLTVLSSIDRITAGALIIGSTATDLTLNPTSTIIQQIGGTPKLTITAGNISANPTTDYDFNIGGIGILDMNYTGNNTNINIYNPSTGYSRLLFHRDAGVLRAQFGVGVALGGFLGASGVNDIFMFTQEGTGKIKFGGNTTETHFEISKNSINANPDTNYNFNIGDVSKLAITAGNILMNPTTNYDFNIGGVSKLAITSTNISARAIDFIDLRIINAGARGYFVGPLINYSDNTTHIFRTANGSSTYANIDSSGLNMSSGKKLIFTDELSGTTSVAGKIQLSSSAYGMSLTLGTVGNVVEYLSGGAHRFNIGGTPVSNININGLTMFSGKKLTFLNEAAGTSVTPGKVELATNNGISYNGGGVVQIVTTNGVDIYTNGTQIATFTSGSAGVNGSFSKPGGGFHIDHPIDPLNKFLDHSFVESPDMLNLYTGKVYLDALGEATVTFPDWFQYLNKEFTYQLSAIGQSMPNLYVSSEISSDTDPDIASGDSFTISGGVDSGYVTWTVMSIRKDKYANHHRIPLETDKTGDDIGVYRYCACCYE
jgi:hypothetical protein